MNVRERVVQVPLRLPVFEAEDVFDRLADDGAVLAATGLIAASHESKARKAGVGDVPAIAATPERAVIVLMTSEEGEAVVDGFLRRRRDHAADHDVVLRGNRGGAEGEKGAGRGTDETDDEMS